MTWNLRSPRFVASTYRYQVKPEVLVAPTQAKPEVASTQTQAKPEVVASTQSP
jgi:hypothetical protein